MNIFKNQSKLYKRTMCVKMIGFIISLTFLIFSNITWLYSDFTMMIWWLFFWYILMWGIIGLIWIMDTHPLFPKFKIYLWRSIAIWAFMNMVLLLIAFDSIYLLSIALGYNIGTVGLFIGFMLEWAFIAWFMDYIGTKYYGEWVKLLKNK